MAGFLLRRLAFGLVAMFAALSLTFWYFASKFYPLRGTSTAHAYWTWLRGIPTGRSLTHGLIHPHLLSMVGAAFGKTMALLALTLVIVIVISIPVGFEPQPVRRAGPWRGLLRQPVAVTAGVILAFVFVIGAIFPRIAPTDAQTIRLAPRWINHPPMWSGWHFLGTDNLGRDILVRTLYGLHTSEQSALLATLLASAIGIALGGIADYYGGWADSLIMRFGDMFGILPAIVILLVAYTYFIPLTVRKETIIFAFYLWIPVARVVRAEIASLREREFVQGGVLLGASDRRIFFRHRLRNGSSTIIVAVTSVFGQVIVLEATLEFFNIAAPSGVTPTLGNLIGDAQAGSITLGLGWWTLVTPAALLILILVCVNLVADGLADALRSVERR